MKMKHLRTLFTALLVLAAFPGVCRVAIYDGKPLEITLPLNKDVVVRFNEPQRVGISAAMRNLISFKPSGDYVILNAAQEVNAQEITFQGLDTGKVVYARISVVPTGSVYDDEVQVRSLDEVKKEQQITAKSVVSAGLTPREVVEALGRAIAQEFGARYAIEDRPFAVTQAASNYVLKPVVGLYKHANINVSPISTYAGGGVYGTAFLFENKSMKPVQIDPGLFRGNWLAIDLLSSDTVLRPGHKTIVTLFHVKPLPTDIREVIYQVRR